MNDDTEHVDRNEFRLIKFAQTCPDCGVAVGEAHDYDEYDGCDIAQCLVTGLQRLMCDLDHDCGRDVWTGLPPGMVDCERLGLMHAPGWPNYYRLYTEATWDAEHCVWVKPSTELAASSDVISDSRP